MRALQAVAMGYVVIALFARQGGYDLLPDPVGWVLILIGVSRLPERLPRTRLLGAAGLALVVSVPLWFPAVLETVAREDDALAWAADLPALLFAGLLFHALAEAATEAGADERTAVVVLRGMLALVVAVAALPVLVFGAGLDAVADLAGAAGQLLNLACVVVLFTYAGRSWAQTTTAAP